MNLVKKLFLLSLVISGQLLAQPFNVWSYNPWEYIKSVSPVIMNTIKDNKSTAALLASSSAVAAIGFIGYKWYQLRNTLASMALEKAGLARQLAESTSQLTQKEQARSVWQTNYETIERQLNDLRNSLAQNTANDQELRNNAQQIQELQKKLKHAQENLDRNRLLLRAQNSAEVSDLVAAQEKQLRQIIEINTSLRKQLAQQSTFQEERTKDEILDRESLLKFTSEGLNAGSSKKLAEMEAAIKNGGLIFYRIITGDINTAPWTVDQYLMHIIDLVWYLNQQSQIKNEMHNEGAYIFAFDKPEYVDRLYKFLLDYVERVNPQWRNQWSHKIVSNPYGYARVSTHLAAITDQQKIQHFGIDIRHGFEEWQNSGSYAGRDYPNATYELPSEKQHLLFFKFIDPVTNITKLFIKPEDHGLNTDAVAAHCAQLGSAIARKMLPGEGDDLAQWRKERVPAYYTSAISRLYGQTGIYPGTIKKFHQLNQLMGLTRRLNNEQEVKLLNQARSEYDYLKERTGREIIISDLEALGSYYYTLQAERKLKEAYAFKQIMQRLYAIKNDARTVKARYYELITGKLPHGSLSQMESSIESIRTNLTEAMQWHQDHQLPRIVNNLLENVIKHYAIVLPAAKITDPAKAIFEDDYI